MWRNGIVLLFGIAANGAVAAGVDEPCRVTITASDGSGLNTGEALELALAKLAKCGWPTVRREFEQISLSVRDGEGARGALGAVLAEVVMQRPETVVMVLRRAGFDGTGSAALRPLLLRDDELARAVVNIDEALPALIDVLLPLMPDDEMSGFAALLLAARDLRRGDVAHAREQIAIAQAAHVDSDDQVAATEFAQEMLEVLENYQVDDTTTNPLASRERWVLQAEPHYRHGNITSGPLAAYGDALRQRGDVDGAVRWWLRETKAGVESSSSLAPLYLLLRQRYSSEELRAEWTRAEATIYCNEFEAGWILLDVSLPLPVAIAPRHEVGPDGNDMPETPLTSDDLLRRVRQSKLRAFIFAE